MLSNNLHFYDWFQSLTISKSARYFTWLDISIYSAVQGEGHLDWHSCEGGAPPWLSREGRGTWNQNQTVIIWYSTCGNLCIDR